MTGESPQNQVRKLAKKVKKLQFIPLELFDRFINRELQIEDLERISRQISAVNKSTVDQKVQISRDLDAKREEKTELYNVAVSSYRQNSGLYFIVHLPENSALFEEVLESLSFSGLGGKRSAGLGRFSWQKVALPQILRERITLSESSAQLAEKNMRLMALTSCLPNNSESEKALEGADYLLKKHSGFAYSVDQNGQTSTGTPLRKQDLYKFASGSTFANSFEGDIFDIRPADFAHEVLNYARPIFFGFEVSEGEKL
jgi:CRISPR-associated protein Csm4